VTDLRQAAEMALEELETQVEHHSGAYLAIDALRQALSQDHGFDRTASHMSGEYVDTESPNDFDPDWDAVEPYLTYISELEEKLEGLSKIKELADYRLTLLTKMPSECLWLTDEELSDTYNFHYNDCASNDIGIADFLVIARAVIARLKDKNNE